MMEWKAAAADKGIKLLDFIKSKIDAQISSRQIKRWIESNGCTVNGRVERFASTLLAEGDVVIFRGLEKLEEGTSPVHAAKESILYEDKDFFIYDKPAGIACTDSSFLVRLNRIHQGLALIHRLDKDTSGAIMLAKTESLRQAMVAAFQQQKIEKKYLAIVDGALAKESGSIESYMGKVASFQGQSLWGSVDKNKGLYALTKWKVKQRGMHATLLECCPITGRTHQIRVHLAGLGHPILGDYQYGKTFKAPLQPRRCLLHALSLSFVHPFTGQKIDVEAPVPQDFISALQTLNMDLPV
jgi:RluA family pseudouridine synthase